MSDKIAAWYSPAVDFAAGIDPTGTSTFRLASKYKGGHGKHQAAGDVGGFVGGTALGAILPAAMIGATGLVLKKKLPKLSGEFMQAAKGSLDVVNPRAMVRHFKSVPDIIKYKTEAFKMMGRGRRLGQMAEGMASRAKGGAEVAKGWYADKSGVMKRVKENISGRLGSGGISQTAAELKGEAGAAIAQGQRRQQMFTDRVKKFGQQQKRVDQMGQELSQKYYGGGPVNIGRTMTALTTIPAAVATGVLNTSSAHMQYNEALRQRRSRGEKVAALSSRATRILAGAAKGANIGQMAGTITGGARSMAHVKKLKPNLLKDTVNVKSTIKKHAPDVVAITTKEELKAYTKNPIKRFALGGALKEGAPANAYYMKAGKKSPAAIVATPEINRSVIGHELGHHADFTQNTGIKSKIHRALSKKRRETKAWDMSPLASAADEPIKREALGSYLAPGRHRRAGSVIGAAGGALREALR